MESENPQEKLFLFNIAQDMGLPSTFPPVAKGKIPAAVQFIIPGFKLWKNDKKNINQLAHKCGAEIYDFNTTSVQNRSTKVAGTLFTFAFYVNQGNDDKENEKIIQSASRLLVERFLGLLSFSLGLKLSAVNLQYTTSKKKGNYSKTLPAKSRASIPKTKVQFPPDIESMNPNDDVFSALFWLRRGLAERDPIENFSALMVSLQIMARHLVEQEPVTNTCPSCGAELETQGPSITSLVRELVVSKLGADPKLFKRLWTARNAIVAHGNKPFTPEVFIELTKLKFDAAILAFQSIKLGLGIPKDAPPSPNQAFFATDAFMHVD